LTLIKILLIDNRNAGDSVTQQVSRTWLQNAGVSRKLPETWRPA